MHLDIDELSKMYKLLMNSAKRTKELTLLFIPLATAQSSGAVFLGLDRSRQRSWLSRLGLGELLASAPGPVLDFGPERGPGKGTMANLGPLIRHLVSTRLPSGGRAAFLSPLSPMHGTRPSV